MEKYIYGAIYLLSICIKKCVHSFTESTQLWRFYDWVMNFGVQIGFIPWPPTKREFCEILYPFPTGGRGSRHQNCVFEHNSVPNYLTLMKLHMRLLDLDTKKSFSAILEFSILKGGKGEKYWISKNLDFRT